MDKLNIFTSTGNKLFRNGEALMYWNMGIPTPLSLQVALTEICNLKCKFCSVANREKKYTLDYDVLVKATEDFINLGTRTVEITGGGDPLLYPRINEYLQFLVEKGMEIGIITNGININSIIDKKFLVKDIAWIRISSNVLDYKDEIDIPQNFGGTLGFSYCWTEEVSTIEQLTKIKDIAIENNVKYVRLVPNCLATKEEQEVNNQKLAKVAEIIGEPVFFQPKVFDTPKNCYWGYFKPFLYADEYVYPCSSTVLNPDADRQFNSKYRWCHVSEISSTWATQPKTIVNTSSCEHCVFTTQNRILDYSLHKQFHEEFI